MASILGIIQAILIFLNQQHLINSNIFELISAVIVAIFGVITNKKNIKLDRSKILIHHGGSNLNHERKQSSKLSSNDSNCGIDL
jgi:ABC-type transport system involved in cytochrome bd biosynthesis fused ATPase/permease subunit